MMERCVVIQQFGSEQFKDSEHECNTAKGGQTVRKGKKKAIDARKLDR